jgi:hypothetical protein
MKDARLSEWLLIYLPVTNLSTTLLPLLRWSSEPWMTKLSTLFKVEKYSVSCFIDSEDPAILVDIIDPILMLPA